MELRNLACCKSFFGSGLYRVVIAGRRLLVDIAKTDFYDTPLREDVFLVRGEWSR